MTKTNVTKFFKDIGEMVSRRSPEILVGIGIAGMCTTVVLAVKATPKALELIEDEKDRQNYELRKEAKNNDCIEISQLKPIDVVKAAWKPYIPAAVTGACSIACIIGASSKYARRNAAIATAYKLSETAFAEYKDKVVETIGKQKEKTVQDKVAKDKIEKNPVTKNEVIITERGNTLCYDTISGRYFRSDIESIKKAVNELNRQMLSDMYISLSEFYDEIGLSHIKNSDEIGWNLDGGLIDITFSSQLANDGTPCVVVDYLVAPKHNFSNFV